MTAESGEPQISGALFCELFVVFEDSSTVCCILFLQAAADCKGKCRDSQNAIYVGGSQSRFSMLEMFRSVKDAIPLTLSTYRANIKNLLIISE